MKKLIAICAVILATVALNAQNYQFTFKVKGAPEGKPAYLANYFGEQLYYYDTATIEKEGVFRFERDQVKEGVFAVVLPGSKYFEVILAEKEVSLETDTANFVKYMNVKKSKENKAFYEYFQFINEKGAEAAPLRQNQDEGSKKKLAEIDKEVKEKQKKMVDQYKNLFFAKVVGMGIDPKIPENLTGDSTKLEAYLYYKNHFWDRFDLQDERIVRTPIFAKRFNYFFDKVVVQNPDSLTKEIDWLLKTTPHKTDLWKFICHTITYKYETSKIMGLDAVFVHMGLNYYKREANGESKIWWLEEAFDKKVKETTQKKNNKESIYNKLKADSTTSQEQLKTSKKELDDANKALKEALKSNGVDKVLKRAQTLAPLRLQEKAPLLILKDTINNQWVNIHEIEADWTLLVFWDAGCGHCKKEIPKLNQLYQEIRHKNNIQFVGINTELKNKEWVKYIKENKLDGWIHISDDPLMNNNPRKYIIDEKKTTLQSLNFRDTYDIFSTPQIFLLDKDKKIIAKKMGVSQLVPFLEGKMDIEIKYEPPVDKKNDTH